MYIVLVFSTFNSKGKVPRKNVVGIAKRAYTWDSDPSVEAVSISMHKGWSVHISVSRKLILLYGKEMVGRENAK